VASPTRVLRVAAVTGFCLLWVAGGLLYVAFPSWGPVYTRPAHFELALQSMPITVHVQTELYRELKALFDDPTGPRPIRYGGVAAFPSLHLAVVALFVLASWKVSRAWGGLNLAIWVTLFAGSMLTGYHYLSDSLAGAVLGAACYLGALRWARWALGPDAPEGGSESGGERQSASPRRDIPRQLLGDPPYQQ
jgi:membrane-associated phospholipid phosphatase